MLQDQAEPRPYADVEHAILRELGMPVGALFAEFEPEARAAASLAQARISSVVPQYTVGVKFPSCRGCGSARVLKPEVLSKSSSALAFSAPCSWYSLRYHA